MLGVVRAADDQLHHAGLNGLDGGNIFLEVRHIARAVDLEVDGGRTVIVFQKAEADFFDTVFCHNLRGGLVDRGEVDLLHL